MPESTTATRRPAPIWSGAIDGRARPSRATSAQRVPRSLKRTNLFLRGPLVSGADHQAAVGALLDIEGHVRTARGAGLDVRRPIFGPDAFA